MSAQQPVLCALALVNIRCTILVCRCLSSSTDPLVWIDLWLCRYNPAGGGKPYMVAVKRLKMELFRCGFLGWASPRSVVRHKLLALSDSTPTSRDAPHNFKVNVSGWSPQSSPYR